MRSDEPLAGDDFVEVELDDWRERVAERLGDKPFESLERRTPDGADLQLLYTRADLEHGVPELPRRAHASGSGWRVCARLERGHAVDVAAALVVARSAGAQAFWLPFDRAARLGLEPDSPSAGQHLGRGGVTLHHGSDLALLLESVTLGGLSLAGSELVLDAGGNALPAVACVLACLETHGIPLDDVVLHSGADPLGSLARDGRLPRDLMKLESEMAVLARFSRDHLGDARAIAISAEPYHDAGATAVQELAYALETLCSYLRALEESGLEIETGSAEIALRFAVGTDLFVEIAKLRAARLLWSMMLRSCGLEDPPAALIHAVGSRRTATRHDPWNNLLRSTGQTFAAACGGADLVSLDAFDRLHGLSDERAFRLAQTTQAILADEALLGRVTDPAAGSCYVERLTHDLAARAWVLAQEIDRRGGMTQGLLSGRIAAELEEAAKARHEAIESGLVSITGVTAFARDDETPLDRMPWEQEEALAHAIERLGTHRSARTAADAEIAYSRNFVLDEMVAEASCGATLAELSLHLGDDTGAETIGALLVRRDAEPFETDRGGGGAS